MEQKPGQPPARALGVTAAAGDALVLLLRRWHDVAAETLPGDHTLTEQLTSRLRDLAVRPTPPAEAELLEITEAAAQHAVSRGAADAARQLSKRLRRAIYEYLLSLDAMSDAEQAPELVTSSGTQASAAPPAPRRDGGRPELVWDEPSLRVLDGGATAPAAGEGVAGAATPPTDAPQLEDGDEPAAHAPAAEHPLDADEDVERPYLVLIETGAEEFAAALGEGAQPAGRTISAEDAAEASRVPERFRRGDPKRAADAPPQPFSTPPASTPLVVPSYRAWADVLASGSEDAPLASAPAQLMTPTEESRPLRRLQARLAANRLADADAAPEPASGLEAHDDRTSDTVEDAQEVAAEAVPVEEDEDSELDPAASVEDEAPIEPEQEPEAVEAEAEVVEAELDEHDEGLAEVGAELHDDDEELGEVDAELDEGDEELDEGDEELDEVEAGAEADVDTEPHDDAQVVSEAHIEHELTGDDHPDDEAEVEAEADEWVEETEDGSDDAIAAEAATTEWLDEDGASGENDEPDDADDDVAASDAPDEDAAAGDGGATEATPDPAEQPAAAAASPSEADIPWHIPTSPALSTVPRWQVPAARAFDGSVADDVPWLPTAAEPAILEWSPTGAEPADAGADSEFVLAETATWPAGSPSRGWGATPEWPATEDGDTQPLVAAQNGQAFDDEDAETDIDSEGEVEEDGDGTYGPTWSIRRSPRQQALQMRMAQRRRDDVIRAAAAAFDESATNNPRRHRLPELVAQRLPEQVDGLLRRKRTGEAAALVQRAAQEIAGREIAELALECGDRCRDRHQNRAAINSYLAAWRADPVYEAPLWRLAETCLADEETELAVGYLERIADLMRARGDDEGALEVYRKVIAVAPDRGDVRALLQATTALGRFPD